MLVTGWQTKREVPFSKKASLEVETETATFTKARYRSPSGLIKHLKCSLLFLSVHLIRGLAEKERGGVETEKPRGFLLLLNRRTHQFFQRCGIFSSAAAASLRAVARTVRSNRERNYWTHVCVGHTRTRARSTTCSLGRSIYIDAQSCCGVPVS